jgi:hypothetical protein
MKKEKEIPAPQTGKGREQNYHGTSRGADNCKTVRHSGKNWLSSS